MAEVYTYRNVTISGLPGCGSTTLLRLLEEEIGWKGYSGGEFMRAYAQEKGFFPKDATVHHDASAYPADFDRQVDYGVRAKLTDHEHLIMEAWLSGFLAQGVEGVLKVLVTCSDDAVRIDRIVNRDNVSIDEAKEHIKAREAKNRAKWAEMYASEWNEWVVQTGKMSQEQEIDFWHPTLYDLVIDTYSNSREETLRKVVEALRG